MTKVNLLFIILGAVWFNNVFAETSSFMTQFDRLTSEVWRYESEFKKNDLTPVKNNIPNRIVQPHRDKPTRI